MVWITGDKRLTEEEEARDIEYVYNEKTLEIYDILYKGVSIGNSRKKNENKK